ncbi:uncharacterized protein N7529_004005 [Penicillium soppii]|uniref:uncharacterized protein n=1 Tax=Penicillium soppii TaxID=69789 RepID=UPI00254914C0|nr:uncharacterized protein N7529_004005 [Penicillium soppii]KAJ5871652.1 hypothetical protein N7529_004005 [Penicillium soppii]
MAHQPTSPHETPGNPDQTLTQHGSVGTIEVPENNNTTEEKTPSWFKIGPSWPELKREWRHGSKGKVAMFFMFSLVCGVCFERTVTQFTLGCSYPFWPIFVVMLITQTVTYVVGFSNAVDL